MKKKTVLMTLIIFLAAASLAVCGNYSSSNQGPPSGGPPGGGGALGNAFQQAVVKRVLQDLTGSVPSALESSSGGRVDMRSILENAGVDQETFQTAVKTESENMLNQAVSCGLLTQQEASDAISRLSSCPQPPRGRRGGGQSQ
ncbi:hypothetical protein Dalk_0876 [Desulfatibacillum aliphaticivorans]|uniref:Lipoprotein n=1 Tax=Desulfatibacillum aliphaticivorans TaxID=218208 RepID=B8FI14_DESAL|nr:hypothetical protein [Desulfatibacillum aliphaticivorans]ACL02581.1 hypothetical protein Dalk_0876 [Desulfatibacillum aliphaticivorans]